MEKFWNERESIEVVADKHDNDVVVLTQWRTNHNGKQGTSLRLQQEEIPLIIQMLNEFRLGTPR